MSQSQSTPTEQLPCDFLAFLQQRHGVSAPAAQSTLGDWLVTYQPGPVARAKAAAVIGAAVVRGPCSASGPAAVDQARRDSRKAA